MSPTTFFLGGFILFNGVEMAISARILFLFPFSMSSRYRAFSPLIQELANRGHEITAYTGKQKLGSLKVHEEININVEESKKLNGPYKTDIVVSRLHKSWSTFRPWVEAILQSEELQALMLSQENFDLVILEGYFMQECFLAFGHKFSAPVISLDPVFLSSWQAQLSGLPHSFSYIPNTFLPYTDEMTLWQRTKNALIGTCEILAGTFYNLPIQEEMMRKYFKYPGSETIPPLRELIANVSLHLVLSHPLMSSVRPYSPNFIDVAGMHLQSAGKLPQDLQKFMDEASEGCIYVSFGSYKFENMFPKQIIDLLAETMKALNQKVIWKWSGRIDGAPNVLTRSWLPQPEILTHPNCKLFITHGGFNSLVEAMSRGVPTIGIPLFSDQYHNVAFYERQGVGLEVEMETITVQEFKSKIIKVLRTPSFAENAKQIAELFRDQPQTSLEKAIFWVEYVIRHRGAHHLQPASAKMPYYQYLLLDVIALLAVSFFILIYTSYRLVCKMVHLWFGSNIPTSKAQKSE